MRRKSSRFSRILSFKIKVAHGVHILIIFKTRVVISLSQTFSLSDPDMAGLLKLVLQPGHLFHIQYRVSCSVSTNLDFAAASVLQGLGMVPLLSAYLLLQAVRLPSRGSHSTPVRKIYRVWSRVKFWQGWANYIILSSVISKVWIS